MIDRMAWVGRHDPVLHAPDPSSPLTVGNGHFAFTADVTGLQSLYDDYGAVTPLCTMADWGWHTAPDDQGQIHRQDEVEMDEFDWCGRTVRYAVNPHPGNEKVYHWLRENPHKANLARIGLRLGGNELKPEMLSGVHQRLDLYRGVLHSEFSLHGVPVRVTTCCHPDADVLAVTVESSLLRSELSIDLDFPYGAPGISASDWRQTGKHTTTLLGNAVQRAMDDLTYSLHIHAPEAHLSQVQPHRVRITADSDVLRLAISFGKGRLEACTAQACEEQSAAGWGAFWQRGGAVDLSKATFVGAQELERRLVLSLYLLAVNSAGRMPPAETGLTCNSWYGKAHLEMHFWHMAWAPLWGHGELLARCLPWYEAHLSQAVNNAARNGFAGARWPKMIGPEGVDSPSTIATLLVWQQPHIIALLTLMHRASGDAAFLEAHWPLVRETADFMADYAVHGDDGLYHLAPPLIPVQERFAPQAVRDPAFETAYWRFGLQLAIRWAEAMGMEASPRWQQVCDGMALPPLHDGRYIAHAACPDTFTAYLDDHPSMLMCMGVLPGEGIDATCMAATLDKVEADWPFMSMWGWDFPVMAMTAAALGDGERALRLLMADTPKNTFVASGHNRQADAAALPLYLPGNGGLLLALALLAQKNLLPGACVEGVLPIWELGDKNPD